MSVFKNPFGKEVFRLKDADIDEKIGEWKDDKKNGEGSLTSADGNFKKRIWENNSCLTTPKSLLGSYQGLYLHSRLSLMSMD